MPETRNPTRAGWREPVAGLTTVSAPGVLLGIGLGGFVDGIVLRQILQWHHMLSATDGDRLGVPHYAPSAVAGLEMNTLWGGLVHAVVWVATLSGWVLLHRRARLPSPGRWGRSLWGWVLVGWGVFNLVEGVVDHHVLAYDLGFLGFGAILVTGGWCWQRTRRGSGS